MIGGNLLEITISDNEKRLLQNAGFKNVMSFCILLSYGNIKNIKNQKDKSLGNLIINVNSQIEEIDNINDKEVRIWYASSDNEDMCTLYFLVSRLHKKNIKIYICDVADGNHFSLGSYSADEIHSLLPKTKIILEKEITEYSNTWENLIRENADLRIIKNNSLISVSFEYFDDKILKTLKKLGKTKYWTLVGECMSKRLCGFYGDTFFIARVNELINEKKIEICEIKKEYNAINELVEQIYLQIVE